MKTPLNLKVALLLKIADLGLGLCLDGWTIGVKTLGVDPCNEVRREVDDLLKLLRGNIEQVTKTARDTLEVPDVGNRSG